MHLLKHKDKLELVSIVRDSKRNKKLMENTVSQGVRVIWGDLRDYNLVKKALAGVDMIMHLAALVSPKADYFPELAWDINVGSTDNLLKAIEELNLFQVKLVYIGTVAQTGSRLPPIHWGRVGDPIKSSTFDAYAASKNAAEPFFQWFIWIGGSGATIGLAIAMAFFSKSTYAKSLGKTAFGPALFNINEPIIFGAPIVLNPIFMIPFMVTPLVLATIAWFATKLGFVNPVTTIAPWTLPGPIGALLATNFDWRAMVLNIVLIVIAFLIYFPFFKVYDQKLLEEEQGNVVTE